MSVLTVTEYQHVERNPAGPLQLPLEDSDTVRQVLTLSGASAMSAVFGTKTRFVRLSAQVDARYSFGTAPNSDILYSYLAAGAETRVGVPVGASWKVAVRTL